MDFNKLKEKCINWSYINWNKGNLINYWEKAGLSLEQILINKEELEKTTFPIAILGSVGKTTLSRILFEIIKEQNINCYLTKVNDNWVPQLPLAIQQALNQKTEVSIFECGIASKGDAELMATFVPAKIIVYTEFTENNLSQFESIEKIINEKISFIDLRKKQKIISHINNKEHFTKREIKCNTFYGQKNSKADMDYYIKKMTENDTLITIMGKKEVTIKINDIGLHLGSACAGALATYLEINEGIFKKKFLELLNYKNPIQRMQRLDYKGIKIILDTANANELSILNSLETLIQLDTSQLKNVVLGEIYGLGDKTEEIIKKVIHKLYNLDLSKISSIHFVGENFFNQKNEITNYLHIKNTFYKNIEDFFLKFNIYNYTNQILLLRGPTKAGMNFSNLLTGYDKSSDETSPLELR